MSEIPSSYVLDMRRRGVRNRSVLNMLRVCKRTPSPERQPSPDEGNDAEDSQTTALRIAG